jgi:hypothetical protein
MECDNTTLPESFAANAYKTSPDVCDGQGVELARRFSSCEIAYRRQRARVNIFCVNVLLLPQNRHPLQNQKRSTAFAIAPARARFSPGRRVVIPRIIRSTCRPLAGSAFGGLDESR